MVSLENQLGAGPRKTREEEPGGKGEAHQADSSLQSGNKVRRHSRGVHRTIANRGQRLDAEEERSAEIAHPQAALRGMQRAGSQH